MELVFVGLILLRRNGVIVFWVRDGGEWGKGVEYRNSDSDREVRREVIIEVGMEMRIRGRMKLVIIGSGNWREEGDGG